MPEHPNAFDALKEYLGTIPILGYPNFNWKFMPETESSLNWLGAMLSQLDDSGKFYVIA